MPLPIGALVATRDLPGRVDLPRLDQESVRNINCAEGASAQHEPMIAEIGVLRRWRTRRRITVTADDVAAGVDPERARRRSTGEIERGEGTGTAQEIAVELAIGRLVAAHDVTAGVNRKGI